MNFTGKGFAGLFLLFFAFSSVDTHARGFAARIEESLDLKTVESISNRNQKNTVIDWSNPEVGCIEDFIPKFLPCLDLSQVVNPVADFPSGLGEAQEKYWNVDHRADLNLCRAKEVERREKATPGSMSDGAIAWAWMWNKQANGIEDKIVAVYDAAEKAKMPPQVLFGALKQESLLSDLGISVDGGNYSCGIGQMNVGEWCRFMQTFTQADQIKFGWPVGISCSNETLPSEIVKASYDIALRKIRGRPDYELTPKEFEGIKFSEVATSFPTGTEELQRKRFAAISSFVKNCSNSRLGILAKGHVLRGLFDSGPEGLKKMQRYPAGETFPRVCMRKYKSPYYPLHTGWLLADAVYNAGDREISLLQYYFRMTKTTHESGTGWKKLTPLDLIEGLHWGGKWNPTTKKIEYQDVYGVSGSQSWFKSCVVQRHIARVVQYATVPGAVIANSLEVGGCSKTEVPAYRKKSSGRKAVKKPAHFHATR